MSPKSNKESATETGDKLQLLAERPIQETNPTAQSAGPPRDRAKKGLEICTPEMWELTAPG